MVVEYPEVEKKGYKTQIVNNLLDIEADSMAQAVRKLKKTRHRHPDLQHTSFHALYIAFQLAFKGKESAEFAGLAWYRERGDSNER